MSETSHEILVSMDTLEYTRQGLRSPQPLQLKVGRNNKVVLVRPDRVAPWVQGAGGFPNNSSFPLPATLAVFWALAKPGTPFTQHAISFPTSATSSFQIFAHASASGDAAGNKLLSDRRGRVGRALLLGDPELLLAVADEEGWGTLEVQAMLRMLSCDPGPIDGQAEIRTESAIAAFQQRYNASAYHRRHQGTPQQQLEENGRWTEPVRSALFEAFVGAHGAGVPETSLHPTHPVNGCSEFNALSTTQDARNRRLTVLGYPTVPEHHGSAPCTQGDESRCAVVDENSQRCMWYREHVVEPAEQAGKFYDPRWMWLFEDRYLLTALTHLPDGAAVEFEVFEAGTRARGSSPVDASVTQSSRSKVLAGEVSRGIAQVVWRSELPVDPADGRPSFDAHPVFRVRDPASGAFSFAPWPEKKTLRLLVGATNPTDVSGSALQYRLRADDGSYEGQAALADATPGSSQHLVVEFADVPLDTRLTLSIGAGGRWAWDVLESVHADGLPGNCRSGGQCKEVPLPVAPPAPEHLDEEDGAVEPWLDADPSDFQERSFG